MMTDDPNDNEIDAANDEAEIRRALTTVEVDRLLAAMTRMRLHLLDQQSGGRGY